MAKNSAKELQAFASKYGRYIQSTCYVDLLEHFSAKKAGSVKVLFGMDDTAYTNDKIIHIGLKMLEDSEDMLADCLYFLGHELQHIHSTTQRDWLKGQQMALQTLVKNISTEVLGKPAHLHSQKDLVMFCKELQKHGVYLTAKSLQETIHHVLNSLEDGRIEGIRSKRHPGFTKYTRQYRYRIWDNPLDTYPAGSPDMSASEELRVVMNQILTMSTMQIWQRGFTAAYLNRGPECTSVSVYDRCYSLIPEIAAAISSRTCKDCMKHGVKILDSLTDLIIAAAKENKYEAMLQNLLEAFLAAAKGDYSIGNTIREDGDGSMPEPISGTSVLVVELEDDEFDELMKHAKDGETEDGVPSVIFKRKHPKTDEPSEDDAKDDTAKPGNASSSAENPKDNSNGEQPNGGSASGSPSDRETDDKTSAGSATGGAGENSDEVAASNTASAGDTTDEQPADNPQNGENGPDDGTPDSSKTGADGGESGENDDGKAGQSDTSINDETSAGSTAGESGQNADNESGSGIQSEDFSSDSTSGKTKFSTDKGERASSTSWPQDESRSSETENDGDTTKAGQYGAGSNTGAMSTMGSDEATDEEIAEAFKDAVQQNMHDLQIAKDAAEAAAKEVEDFRKNAKVDNPHPSEQIDVSGLNELFYENHSIQFVEQRREYKPDEMLPFALRNRAQKFRQKIESQLQGKTAPKRRAQRAGSVDASRLAKLVMGDFDFYRKRDIAYKPDVAVYILIDNSGSMTGDKHTYAMEASAVVEEGFKGLCALKVVAFDAFGSNSVRHALVKDWEETGNVNLSYNFLAKDETGYGNKDGYSIRVATADILNRPEKNKMLLVLSDGMPSDYSGGERAGIADVTDAVKNARQSGVLTIGIFFEEVLDDRNCNMFRTMYGAQSICTTPDMIEDELTRIMSKFFFR